MKTLLKLGALCLLVYLLFSHLLGPYIADIKSLHTNNPSRTAYMGKGSRSLNQDWVCLSQISVNLRRAVIIAEDGRFYQHGGVDFHELKESVKRNISDLAFSRGFSTITMQLARNLYLSPEKNVLRKFREILIAFYMERKLSKDRILEIYLNVIQWGPGIYGAEAASRHYFNKTVDSLTANEAAFLAAIIPSPQRYGRWPPNPYIEQRMNVILDRIQTRWGDS